MSNSTTYVEPQVVKDAKKHALRLQKARLLKIEHAERVEKDREQAVIDKAYEDKRLQAIKEGYQELFSTELGKQILEDIQQKCFFYTSAYDKDKDQFLINTGMNNVILMINEQITDKDK